MDGWRERERERDRDRDRQTDRQTVRDRQRQRDRKTERDRDRETDIDRQGHCGINDRWHTRTFWHLNPTVGRPSDFCSVYVPICKAHWMKSV